MAQDARGHAVNQIDDTKRCDRSVVDDYESAKETGFFEDNNNISEDGPSNWFCSLERGHVGAHVAHNEHDLDAEAIYIWSLGSMPILEIV